MIALHLFHVWECFGRILMFVASVQGGATALMLATEADKVECVNTLLKRGAKLDAIDRVCQVILQHAMTC